MTESDAKSALPWIAVSKDMNLSFLEDMASTPYRVAQESYRPAVGYSAGSMFIIPSHQNEIPRLAKCMEEGGHLRGVYLENWGMEECTDAGTVEAMARYEASRRKRQKAFSSVPLVFMYLLVCAEMLQHFRWFYALAFLYSQVPDFPRLFAVSRCRARQPGVEVEEDGKPVTAVTRPVTRAVSSRNNKSRQNLYVFSDRRVWEFQFPGQLSATWFDLVDADFYFSIIGRMPTLDDRPVPPYQSIGLFLGVFLAMFSLELAMTLDILYAWPFSLTKLLALGLYGFDLVRTVQKAGLFYA